jgi:hypothetical protein
MLAKSFKFLLLILFIASALLLEAFLILPFHHSVMFFLTANLFSGLSFSYLLKNVSLLLFNKLFFEFDLVLLAAHPFFMRDGSSTALTNLTSLLNRAVVHSCVLASGNVRLVVEVGK